MAKAARITYADIAAHAAQLASALEQREQWVGIVETYAHSRNAVIATLRTQLTQADAQIDELERIARVGAYATGAQRPARPARVVPQDELDRVARMQAAKELAMRTGHTTKV